MEMMEILQMVLVLFGMITSVVVTIGVYLLKQIMALKNDIAAICERLAKEETKSAIYHPKKWTALVSILNKGNIPIVGL